MDYALRSKSVRGITMGKLPKSLPSLAVVAVAVILAGMSGMDITSDGQHSICINLETHDKTGLIEHVDGP